MVKVGDGLAHGKYKPRLLKKIGPGQAMLSRTSGSNWNTPKYQKKSCTSRGTFRIVSI
jgi:hypothetical protein